MSREAQRVYLTNLMKDNVGSYGFPIAYPNVKFDIPTNAPYGEFHIISGPEPIIVGGEGKGKARVRYVGMVQLTVWIPKDRGTKLATVAEDRFRTLFQFRLGRDSAGSTYRFKAAQDFNPQTKEGWECHVVRVPFQRDTVEDVQITV